jgi:hypothetical protein
MASTSSSKSSTGYGSVSSASKKATGIARAAQKRTFHFFVRVTDEDGNTIPNAKLKVERIMTDARKVVEFLDTPEYATSGLIRIKHEVIATPRGGEVDGATSVG